jgi:hypothetical protein
MIRLFAGALACGLALLGPAAGAAQARDFSPRIDNAWLPLRVGSSWLYRDVITGERTTVRVTNRTRRIANGVSARVVRDTVRLRGKVVEDTFDWYAQDRRGNVWYMGEDTTEYENGRPVSKQGSFEAGVDGAKAGIAMLGRPRPGREYAQERYPGHAMDRARVLSRDDQAEVPAGHFRDVVTTKDWNPLEPRLLEFKLYARGVGLVLAVGISGGAAREELVRYEPGGRARSASSISKRASGSSSSSPSSSRSRASR